MIFVDRNRVPEPQRLKKVREAGLRHARAFFTKTARKERRQLRYFNPHWKEAEKIPLKALNRLFHGKCAFCERFVLSDAPGAVEHWRPKWATRGLKREFSLTHYWWLAFSWENLYLSCLDCNKHRGPRFPVEGERTLGPGDDISLESPLLLDPCADRPEEHLQFQHSGHVQPLTRRGEVTIALMALNRVQLVRSRLGVIQTVEAGFEAASHALSTSEHDAAVEELNGLTSPHSQFSACARQILIKLLQSGIVLDGLIVKPEWESERSRVIHSSTKQFAPRYIDQVQVRDFRGIANLTVRSPNSDQTKMDWLVLIGENGVGKSSVLQAIALNLMSARDRDALKLKPTRFIRRGSRKAEVSVRFRNDDVVRVLSIDPAGFHCSEASAAAPLMAYGATRVPSLTAARNRRVPTENLFNPFATLLDPTRWLLKLAKSRSKAEREYFDYATHALAALLPERRRQWRFRIKLAEVIVEPEGTLRELSDGYQSVIALASDVMATMRHEFQGGLEAAEGIAIVDELGVHLHPAWKMRLTTVLRAAFPRIQFIATTHDPLCLRGLRNGEVAVMERSRGRVHARTDLPPIEGMRVEQILQSECFGLRSTFDPAIEKKFDRLYALKVKPNVVLRPSEQQELLALELELADYSVPGSTRAERLMLSEIERYLAKERISIGKVTHEKAWKTTQRTIARRMHRELGITL